ncbi:MAG: hypothetical protein ABIR04_08705 [Cypionkella sp.]
MDILGGITAATEGIKLVNELRKIDKEVDKADLKIRLVELADKLLDSKQALQDAQEERRELLLKVERLEDALKFKANTQDEKGKLYVLNDAGQRDSEPFCNLCFVREGKLYRMIRQRGDKYSSPSYWCNNCRDAYYD